MAKEYPTALFASREDEIASVEKYLAYLREQSARGAIQEGPFCLYTLILDTEKRLDRLYAGE